MKNKEGVSVYPHSSHIGFIMDSVEKVNEIFQKLNAVGIVGGQEPKK